MWEWRREVECGFTYMITVVPSILGQKLSSSFFQSGTLLYQGRLRRHLHDRRTRLFLDTASDLIKIWTMSLGMRLLLCIAHSVLTHVSQLFQGFWCVLLVHVSQLFQGFWCVLLVVRLNITEPFKNFSFSGSLIKRW